MVSELLLKPMKLKQIFGGESFALCHDLKQSISTTYTRDFEIEIGAWQASCGKPTAARRPAAASQQRQAGCGPKADDGEAAASGVVQMTLGAWLGVDETNNPNQQ